jgi:cytochrome b
VTSNETESANNHASGTTVWDPVVRFGHWALVVAFAIAYFSAEEEAGGPDVLHVWGGYAVGAIIILRVLWGFIGSKYARFSDFVGEVVSAPRYLVDLVRGRARRYLGHSPAGGAMIIALLVSLAATVATGVIAYGERGKGPLAVNGAGIVKQAAAEEDEDVRAVPKAGAKGEESVMGELHDSLANITLALIILHVLGVGLASFVHRENLLVAMITGRKRAED